MIRTYKRKLILTKEQSHRIGSWIGACRVIYNACLEIKIASYKAFGKSPSAFDLSKQLPDVKKDIEWIKDVPAQSLQAAVERLDRSYQNFFRGAGFPKWASKKNYKSILFKSVSVDGNCAILPKLGSVRMFKDAPISGNPKTAQIIIEPSGFFICIQCNDVAVKFNSESQAVGLDMGIAHFSIASDGTMIANPKHFAKYERRLRIEGRSLARKKKGSNNWKKQVKQLAKLHHTIGNVRRDFLHKESTRIARQNSVVYMEDLKIRNMSKNRHLSKHILDCGWSMFRSMLEYKTNVIAVDPKHTSQTCHACGTKDAKSRISQSEFVCTSCGMLSHADINAARNILSRGAALERQRKAVA